MKYLKFVVVVFALYFLGYVLEPTVAPMLVKERKYVDASSASVEYNGIRYTIILNDYPDEELPEMVKIINPAQIPTLSGEGQVLLKNGDMVKVLSREEGVLTVEKADSKGKGDINANDTDIHIQFAQQKYENEVGVSGDTVAGMDETPEPAAKAASAPMADREPASVAKTDDMGMSSPAPVTESAPTDPAPTPAEAGGAKLTDEQIVELMKKSIEEGSVKEFTSDEVKDWKANGEETIDGSEYQTGLASYEAATIFGVRPVQAKALIKGGKIDRWVYAKSGMEIQ